MKTLVGKHPFLVFGLATLLFFFGAAALPDSALRTALIAVAQLVIIPMYAGWDAATILAHVVLPARVWTGWLAWVLAGVELAAGILPYALADLLWRRSRRRAAKRADA